MQGPNLEQLCQGTHLNSTQMSPGNTIVLYFITCVV